MVFRQNVSGTKFEEVGKRDIQVRTMPILHLFPQLMVVFSLRDKAETLNPKP